MCVRGVGGPGWAIGSALCGHGGVTAPCNGGATAPCHGSLSRLLVTVSSRRRHGSLSRWRHGSLSRSCHGRWRRTKPLLLLFITAPCHGSLSRRHCSLSRPSHGRLTGVGGALSRRGMACAAANAAADRQWPEVYDSCHIFLHVARVRKHTDMRESLACTLRESLACPRFSHVRVNLSHVRDSRMSVCFQFRVQFSHVRVFSDSRNVQKRATKSDTSGHCLAPAEDGRGMGATRIRCRGV